MQYYYLNQIAQHTKGKAEPQQILHAAANGLINLYAHTPQLIEHGSRFSLLSVTSCQLIEITYNTCCAVEEADDFVFLEFTMDGPTTRKMADGTLQSCYDLFQPQGCNLSSPRLQELEESESKLGTHRISFRLSGAEFIVFKSDIDTLLSTQVAPHETKTFGSDQNTATTNSNDETEIKRLQRTVAALALGLMKKHGNTYNRNGEPNASQLAKVATDHLRGATSDRTPHGFSDTTVRQTITAALKACPELKG
jgi:hypothetical protein